jgi:hypothetical protein
VTSRARPGFWRAYARLSETNRVAARRAYATFAESPDHPSLRFKKLSGYDHVWSVRINEQYRAIHAAPCQRTQPRAETQSAQRKTIFSFFYFGGFFPSARFHKVASALF